MNSGSYVLNATKQKKERVGRILQMHANKREIIYWGNHRGEKNHNIYTRGKIFRMRRIL